MEDPSSAGAESYRTRAAPGHAVPTAVVLLLGAVPLLLARPAPLQDWPNHLARVAIVDAMLHGDPFWMRFYTLGTFLVPNAALDLVVLGLHRLGASIPVAGELFLLLTYGVFVAGFRALARALLAWDATKPPLAVLLFYSHALFWGLANYVLGLGLLMGLLALWLRCRSARGRLAVALAGTALLMVVHVVAAAAFAGVVASIEAAALVLVRPPARRCLSGAAGLLLLAAWLRLAPGGTGHDLTPVYAGGGAWLAWKRDVLATVLLGGPPWQDVATVCVMLLALLAPARLRLPAGAAAGAAIMASVLLVLAAPERLGTGSLLDERLALLPLLLAAAATRPIFPGLARRRVALAVLLLTVGLRTVALGAGWIEASKVFARFDGAAAALPPGGLMMMAYGRPLDSLSWADIWSPPIQSIATQVVARRLFFPAVFANPAQQPIGLRPAYAAIAQPWNLASAPSLEAARAAFRRLCAAGGYTGVFVTVLYPSRFAERATASALLVRDEDFLLLDACRLGAER